MVKFLGLILIFGLPRDIYGYVGEENWIAIFNGHPYHPKLRSGAHTTDHPFYPARFEEHPKNFGSYLNDGFLAYWLEHNPHYEVFGQTFEDERKRICAKFPDRNGYDQMIKCSGFRVLVNNRPVYDRNDSDFFIRPIIAPQNQNLWPVPQAPIGQGAWHPPLTFQPPQQQQQARIGQSAQSEPQAQSQIGQGVNVEPQAPIGQGARPPSAPVERHHPGEGLGHWYRDEQGKFAWHEGVDGREGHWFNDKDGWHWHSSIGKEYTIHAKRRRRHRASRNRPFVIDRLRRQRQVGSRNEYGESVEFLGQKAAIIVDPRRQNSFFGTIKPIYKDRNELEAIGVNYEGKVINVPLSGQNAYQGYQVYQIYRGRNY